MARRVAKVHWCDCPNGPRLYLPPPLPYEITEFSAGRDGSADSKIHFPEAYDQVVKPEGLTLEHVSKITYRFWKPLVIPIDLTVDVPMRRP